MKKMNVFSIACICLISTVIYSSPKINKQDKETEQVAYLLENPLLGFADGLGAGIKGEYIGLTLQIKRDGTAMQYGIKDAQGKTIGLFNFQGAKHTIRSLRTIEAEYELLWCQLQQPLPAHATSDQIKLRTQQIEALHVVRAALKNALQEAKNYFILKILPFTEHAQGVQKLMISLIEESCTKRSRSNSFLFTWGECEPGKEQDLIEKRIASFQMFDDFITDLMNFLTDIIYSCPKARADFLVIAKQKMGPTKTR